MDNDPDRLSLDLDSLARQYRAGTLKPTELVYLVYERMRAHDGNPIWITLRPREELLAEARALERAKPAELPLYGIPFAVKDNIDVAGMPTTAGCAEYAYVPQQGAPVVDRLRAAGALLIGKTNLDQFATGLVGTRSPYGICHNAFNPHFIAGGSSSGSAVAVSLGLVSFALGTDTAGSGRVPAAFNNIVGLKPTRGLLSTRGVVPACRSLDCVAVFALTSQDALQVHGILDAFDEEDAFSRRDREQNTGGTKGFRFGVPRAQDLEFFGDSDAAGLYDAACQRLASLGGERVEVTLEPFLKAQRLLYDGPWIAERYAALKDFMLHHEAALHPVTRKVIGMGACPRASDYFEAYYQLRQYQRQTEAIWADIDLLLLPTTGTIHSIVRTLQDPVQRNTELGRYTNFVNLLDLCALALPAGFRSDGLPLGISLVAPALHDAWLCELGARYEDALGLSPGIAGQPQPLQDGESLPLHASELAQMAASQEVPAARLQQGRAGL